MCESLCKWLKKGCSYKDACAMEGISYQTFNEWSKEKSEFSDAIKKAEVECKAGRIVIILRAADKSWQAAAWFLERRYPAEFARKEAPKSDGVFQAIFSVPQSQFIGKKNGKHPRECLAKAQSKVQNETLKKKSVRAAALGKA